MSKTSFRYGGGKEDARSVFMRWCGRLQKKETVILHTHPENFGDILAASKTKGTFLEQIIATPAWDPIYSIESVDGELWEELSRNCQQVMSQIKFRERLGPIIAREFDTLSGQASATDFIVDAEAISRLTLRTMYELLFDSRISLDDELLFYSASIEWRKEIAVKGKGDKRVKNAFWQRLTRIVEESQFGERLKDYQRDPGRWLSVFAQPFLISPQINVSDIMVAVFRFLRSDSKHMNNALRWAQENDIARLNGVILESIRLQHPFPILERELESDVRTETVDLKTGTQVFMMLDQMEQDKTFDPERWLQNSSENPYVAIPFGAGRRMCVGKPIAQELLRGILQNLLLHLKDHQICPEQGHLYSGRNNDVTKSWSEPVYQANTFGRALWTSYLIGRRKTQPEAPARCPYAHQSAGGLKLTEV